MSVNIVAGLYIFNNDKQFFPHSFFSLLYLLLCAMCTIFFKQILRLLELYIFIAKCRSQIHDKFNNNTAKTIVYCNKE